MVDSFYCVSVNPTFNPKYVNQGILGVLKALVIQEVIKYCIVLGLVVQSAVSLTKSLVEDSGSLRVLTKSVAAIFLPKFELQKLLIFPTKMAAFYVYYF